MAQWHIGQSEPGSGRLNQITWAQKEDECWLLKLFRYPMIVLFPHQTRTGTHDYSLDVTLRVATYLIIVTDFTWGKAILGDGE